MYNSFTSLDELFNFIKEDKEWQGANSGQHNRYPIRFVLFDNFVDFTEFIINRPGNIFTYSLDSLLDKEYPDTFASYSALAAEVSSIVKQLPANDFVIFPFSEMARFYDAKSFESLVKTIRLKQPPEDSQNEHTRIYIPIVGMQGKMSKFINDAQSFVWELKGTGEHGLYNLIIADGTTYGVSGLSQNYSVVQNLAEWLRLWKKGADVKQSIICSSKSIYDTAQNAQPDNAFTYIDCHNAFDFLTKGLQIDFGDVKEPSADELKYWEQLAELIDVTTFNFDTFINERFDTFHLQNSLDFIKTWDECKTDFDCWLLTLYYRKISQGEGYVNLALSQCNNLSTAELFSNIATAIFDTNFQESYLEERRQAMQLAATKNIKLTAEAEQRINAKLKAIATNPELGIYTALKLLTSLSESERKLIVEWVGLGKIQPSQVQKIFPDLFYYLKPMNLPQLGESGQWIADYFNAYRRAKISNGENSEVAAAIQEYNGSTSDFAGWRDNIKTVRTVLHNREDIDVFYWIDGLGADWIPFISQVISEHSKENVYLNEIHLATAALPTTTSKNKPILESLLPEGQKLEKIGDIDFFAHSQKSYPQFIIDEMAMVREAIQKVLTQYNGKKITFISDHGLTYLSQHQNGLKLAGMTSNHEGRLAIADKKPVSDNKYLILDDEITVCSLTHASLTDKVCVGHGAHGGCTPEEVIVPIIIVSSQKNTSNYSVNIDTDDIDGTNPVVDFTIRGLNTIDNPILEYNGTTYALKSIGADKYRSERLNLVDTATKVFVRIGDSFKKPFNIHVSTGATEDDLFGF